jgi:LacI family transcriptional regulator
MEGRSARSPQVVFRISKVVPHEGAIRDLRRCSTSTGERLVARRCQRGEYAAVNFPRDWTLPVVRRRPSERARAARGEIMAQNRNARLIDVAKHANVSIKTVSRALHNMPDVSDATRAKVAQAALDLNYVPDGLGRALRLQRTESVGLLVPDAVNGFYAMLVRSIADALRPHGLQVLLGDSNEDPMTQDAYLRRFRQQRVDGLLVIPVESQTFRPTIRDLPTVVLDRIFTDLKNVDTVSADNEDAAAALVEHMIMRHRLRRIVVIAGDLSSPVIAARCAGYERVVTAAGLTPIIASGHRTSDDAAAGALAALAKIRPPYGVLATNHRMFWGATAALAQLGMRVPKDVTLTSFDSIGEATVTGLIPTSAVIPHSKMAQLAVDALVKRIESPNRRAQSIVLNCDIQLGTTCGCLKLDKLPLGLGVDAS